jgi:hypothetical protein
MPHDQYHCHINNFVPIWYAKELIINLFWGPWPWGPCENWFCWIEALILQPLVPDSYTMSGLHVTRALWEMILLDKGSRRIRHPHQGPGDWGGRGMLNFCVHVHETNHVQCPHPDPPPPYQFQFAPYNPLASHIKLKRKRKNSVMKRDIFFVTNQCLLLTTYNPIPVCIKIYNTILIHTCMCWD